MLHRVLLCSCFDVILSICMPCYCSITGSHPLDNVLPPWCFVIMVLIFISLLYCQFRLMVFNATLNNILAVLWRSVFFMEETGIPGENHRPAADHQQTLSQNVISSTPRHERGSNSQLQWSLVVIGTDTLLSVLSWFDKIQNTKENVIDKYTCVICKVYVPQINSMVI